MTPRLRPPGSLARIAATLALSIIAAACGDLTRPKPQSSNFTDTLSVFAINGTASDAATGLWLFGNQAVQLDVAFNFDLAYDIDAQGNITLYTVRYVAGGLASVHTVALQRVSTTFENLTEAPQKGYVADTLFTVSPGDVFAVVSNDPSACSFSLYSNQIYAKLQVLDVDLARRSVRSRFTVNPNCGFLSLIPSGIPSK
jgi:hypothetical protein